MSSGNVSAISDSTFKIFFGPLGDYTSKGPNENGGLGYAFLSPSVSSTGITRGGSYEATTGPGVFGVLVTMPTTSSSDLGFRCVYE